MKRMQLYYNISFKIILPKVIKRFYKCTWNEDKIFNDNDSFACDGRMPP